MYNLYPKIAIKFFNEKLSLNEQTEPNSYLTFYLLLLQFDQSVRDWGLYWKLNHLYKQENFHDVTGWYRRFW